jgi:hypothetical protein
LKLKAKGNESKYNLLHLVRSPVERQHTATGNSLKINARNTAINAQTVGDENKILAKNRPKFWGVIHKTFPKSSDAWGMF